MDADFQIIEVDTAQKTTQRFVFVLMQDFTLLSFASALDALRIANRMANKPLYEWLVIGEDGDTVNCSAGTSFKLDDDLIELKRDDMVMLCGGMKIRENTTKRLLNWIRREARKGLAFAGLCTAA